jgi:glycosyltransferase involved in cell wall biosynthesis
VHLEDNEEQILMNRLQRTMQELYSYSEEELSRIIPGNLSHPLFYKEFLSKADGITFIIERLSEFIPESKPNMVLWPGIDRARFHPEHFDNKLRYALGLDEDVVVLCYTGNVHHSNWEEVRSLYCAVALLNLEGIPTRLLRTGVDHVQFLGDDLAWAQEYSIEIGFVPHDMIPQLLSVADILVQPGRADEYNAYRLPSKLPEFFWMRKPVILPKVNIGLLVTDGREALLLHEGGAREIVEKVRMILADPQLAEELSYHAGIFAEQAFDAEKNTEKLESFYRAVLNGA